MSSDSSSLTRLASQLDTQPISAILWKMNAFVCSTWRILSHSLRLLFYLVVQDSLLGFLCLCWVIFGRSYSAVSVEEVEELALAAYYWVCRVRLRQSLEHNRVLVWFVVNWSPFPGKISSSEDPLDSSSLFFVLNQILWFIKTSNAKLVHYTF